MNKQFIAILFFFILAPLSIFSQTDSLSIMQLTTEIDVLKKEIATIKQQQLIATSEAVRGQEALKENAQQKYTDLNLLFTEHTDSLVNYYRYIFGIIPEIEQNGEKIKDIEEKKQQSDDQIWTDALVNLQYMPRTFRSINSRLNIIQSNLSNQQKNELLLQITNPQSGALGFKLGDKIMELLQSQILEKAKPKTGRKKDLDEYKAKSITIINVVELITKSPVMNSIPGISSALSMTNVATGFLRSISFMENQISQSYITDFENELNRYILFYNSLHQNQQQNTYNTTRLENKLTALQASFFQFVEINASALDFTFSGKPEKYPSTAAYFTAFADDFESHTLKYLKNYQAKNNDGSLSKRTEMLIELNKDMDRMLHFYNELKKLYEEYAIDEQNHHEATKKTLQMAAESGIASEKKVKSMIKKLNKATENSIQNFNVAVNLPGLEKEIKNISYKYKMF